MATEFPQAGSFTTYSARFVDEAFGFAIGWNYAFNDAVSTAGDLTAAQVIISYWTPHLNFLPSLFFLFFLVAINLIHVKAYGEVSSFSAPFLLFFFLLFWFLSVSPLQNQWMLTHLFSTLQLEYWLSLLKVVSIVIFFFLGIAVNCGGNTAGEYSMSPIVLSSRKS